MTSRLIEMREPTDVEWGRAGGEVVFIREDAGGQRHTIHARRTECGSYVQWGVCGSLLGDNVDDVSRWARKRQMIPHSLNVRLRKWIEDTRHKAAGRKAEIDVPELQVIATEEDRKRLRAYQYGYQVGMESATKDIEALLKEQLDALKAALKADPAE